jgi:hypothetical protein
MKIFIQYENNKSIYQTEKYQSVYSIISNSLLLNNTITNKNPDDYFLDYNGQYLNKNNCIEKYINYENNCENNCENPELEYEENKSIVLNLFEKKRGGSSFFSFAAKNPMTVFIVLIISILPVFLLPTGIVPLISSLIKNIVEKSLDAIGKYLACVLGKKTLYKRIRLILIFIQYIISVSMVFIMISFPIVLLCITLKGHTLGDNPQNMCSPIKVGNMVGMCLVICYVGLYILYRCGNYIFESLIYICKFSYYLNMLFVPTFKSILGVFNRTKYLPLYMIPFLGQFLLAFHTSSELSLIAAEMIFGSLTMMGCSAVDTKSLSEGAKGFKKGAKYAAGKMKDGKKFMSSVMKQVKDFKGKMAGPSECECARRHREEEAAKEEASKNNENNIPDFKVTDNLCYQDKIQCCSPERYVDIADMLNTLITSPFLSEGIKYIGLFPAFVLFTTALYEAALLRMGDDDDILTKTVEQKKYYLRKILKDKVELLESDTKKMIKDYLDDEEIDQNSNVLIYEIKKMINRNAPSDIEGIQLLKDRIAGIEEAMVDFARESGTVYTPGKSLFKNIFKILFMDIFCNVASTAKNGKDVIKAMGTMSTIVDMLKSGSSSGVVTAFIYLFTVIAVIICGIFNVF